MMICRVKLRTEEKETPAVESSAKGPETVYKWIASSNLVGCSTGKAVRLTPFRIV
jgi:hypothetical protein